MKINTKTFKNPTILKNTYRPNLNYKSSQQKLMNGRNHLAEHVRKQTNTRKDPTHTHTIRTHATHPDFSDNLLAKRALLSAESSQRKLRFPLAAGLPPKRPGRAYAPVPAGIAPRPVSAFPGAARAYLNFELSLARFVFAESFARPSEGVAL